MLLWHFRERETHLNPQNKVMQNNFNSLLNPISVLTLTLAAVWVRSQLPFGSHKNTELITFLLINLTPFYLYSVKSQKNTAVCGKIGGGEGKLQCHR